MSPQLFILLYKDKYFGLPENCTNTLRSTSLQYFIIPVCWQNKIRSMVWIAMLIQLVSWKHVLTLCNSRRETGCGRLPLGINSDKFEIIRALSLSTKAEISGEDLF